MRPYYQEAGITIYHGDAREILPSLDASVLITDPIWPDCEHIFPGIDAMGLLQMTLESAPASIIRLAIHLGCNSDPRFLLAVPRRWSFFRNATLDYARVGYKGRLLVTGDTAYLFGEVPKSRQGAHVIPGRMVDASSTGRESDHPCPRKVNHVGWLVRWWSEPSDVIVDPFCGSGTTLIAAKNLGRRAFGVDIEEKYCEEAANRLRQSVFNFEEKSA